MVRIFEIPEILCLICEQVPKYELAELLSTSRSFFDCAAPLLWETLPQSAPLILIKLLPNGDSYLKHDHNTIVENIQPLDSQSLVRFNFYSPYVKKISPNKWLPDGQWNAMWYRLFRLIKTRPILPKLQVLGISLARLGDGTLRDPFTWLSALLSPSLVEIDDIRDRYAHIPMGPQSLCSFISNAAQRCPRIYSLSLNNVARYEPDPSFGTRIASPFSQLRYLRILVLEGVVLEPQLFTALSSLSSLKSLALEEADNVNFMIQPKRFIPHDFPAVQYLELTLKSQANIIKFMEAICKFSPLVNRLSLKCTTHSEALLSPELFSVLSQLPLQQLTLRLHDHDCAPLNSEQFARTFPALEYLHIYGYIFTFRDFTFIAKHMPQLRQLLLMVRVGANQGWPSINELSSLTLSPSPSQLYFYLLPIPLSTGRGALPPSRVSKREVAAIAA
ncbi:unnamed protein product [Rhizoctonia solani]|uniref:F-box domain-containing protein n=1 Tax=Rhizoctonia solani TaxID=456999 RepID=A0A8H3CHD7_9AGAM|nr:unnamed protein product [Rhizoctonia solani]